jgi:hypothetical protein
MLPASSLDLLYPVLADSPDYSGITDGKRWAAIRNCAGAFGVAPLIAYAARQHLAGEERMWCDRVLVESWRRYQRMLGQLQDLTTEFEADQIPVIALKGPLLARRYYNPPFLRKPSLDLDFAVADHHLERAVRALQRAGYTPDAPLNRARLDSHHVEMSHPSRPPVELHFRLTHRALGIPVEEFFERAMRSDLPDGRQILILGPADQLLHLMLHFAQSRFGTVFHLCEIRRAWQSATAEVRQEAIRRASHHRYNGVLRMMEVAFRCRWNEPFLPPGTTVPGTWLNWRLNTELYRRFERFSLPGRRIGVGDRMFARWLDFQITDTPVEALKAFLFFGRTALLNFTDKRSWRLLRPIRFAPGRFDPPVAEQPLKDVSRRVN